MLGERHKAVSEEMAAAMATQVTIGMLLSSAKGSWDVSVGLSGLFPGYRFSKIEEFLAGVWPGDK